MFARHVETQCLVVNTNVTLVGVTISHEAAPYQQQCPSLKNTQTKEDKPRLEEQPQGAYIRIRVGSLEFLGPWGRLPYRYQQPWEKEKVVAVVRPRRPLRAYDR